MNKKRHIISLLLAMIMLIMLIISCNANRVADKRRTDQSVSSLTHPASSSVLAQSQWRHGAENCAVQQDPLWERYQHDPQTFIFRQNKCFSYQAPFIYLLIGKDRILLIDTGDVDSKDLTQDARFSLYHYIKSSIGLAHQDKPWLVLHTHAHNDHTAADNDFINQQQVLLIGSNAIALQAFFNFKHWPNDITQLELGERQLSIIPTPGHQEDAISLYDPHTQWLLTGDTLYPGKIYVKHWQDYRQSIARLNKFASQHPVTAILGAHIEMKQQAGEYYPIGSRYQPEEYQLDLSLNDLKKLHFALNQNPNSDKNEAKTLVFDHFIIEPMTRLQRWFSNILRFFSGA